MSECTDIFGMVTNSTIAMSAVAAAIAAWAALSSWKRLISYNMAMQCMTDANLLHVALIEDRFRLSNTSIEHWNNVKLEVSDAGGKYGLSSIKAQYHFGEKNVGAVFMELFNFSIEFRRCSFIFDKYKRSVELTTEEKLLLPTAVEIFESPNSLDVNDSYQVKVNLAHENVKDFLLKHMEIFK